MHLDEVVKILEREVEECEVEGWHILTYYVHKLGLDQDEFRDFVIDRAQDGLLYSEQEGVIPSYIATWIDGFLIGLLTRERK